MSHRHGKSIVSIISTLFCKDSEECEKGFRHREHDRRRVELFVRFLLDHRYG